ncbi:MAG TPA: DUF2917 domain-containing protein [Ramlibacter sp.]|uniref:DUF2917 domain-containing protein n=1 Tax=Ramlibacter sp. TaxID=1917967 RepID=UPI002C06A7BB|nr:DUF2917 domain-containing protein [Ramlibacter sp.]HVZ43220.1 DUF2917 domain-containing protein [Ramlibacter sp.]
MQAQFDRGRIGLQKRGIFEIADPAGVEISCMSGSLWITLDNDPRDITLKAGETFFTTEHRRAIVYAFEPSMVAMRDRAAVQRSDRLKLAKNSSDCTRSVPAWAATRAAIAG